MAISNDTNFDIVTSWLIKIAENTAKVRDAATQGSGGGGGGADKAREDGKHESRFEKLGKRIEQALAVQTGMRLAQAQGLANRGFGGTVEGARHDFAMEQLGRQFAAVMMPVMQAATYLAGQIEQRMRGMNGGEQNRLMGGLVGAGVGLRYGGLMGAAAGGMLGMTAMGGQHENNALMGMAGGAYAGFRLGGVPGAAAGAMAGLAAGSPVHYDDEGPNAYYRRMRNRPGSSFLGSGFATVGRAISKLYGDTMRGTGIDSDSDAGRAYGGTIGLGRRDAAEARRDVTPFVSHMEDAGATSMRAQEATIRATAGEGLEADGGPFKPLVDAIMKIYDWLVENGGSAAAGGAAPRGARE